MSETITNIGKFKVVKWLGCGGMAEVFLCRLTGIGGFDKNVIVKRILPERVNDLEFVKMFLDEGKLTANLNHPNIFQIFEIDVADEIPYIAMEYVKGPTLAALTKNARKQNKVHFGHFAQIISGICEGLQYAHSATDSEGEPLGLIHRDVSPANIIISTEGIPKLLDFGVARAKGRLANTEAGTLKGKIRYIAPECITNQAIDHRVDIFSLGVCLYEATTGQNPYGAEKLSEVSLLKNLLAGAYYKPSQVVEHFPKELEKAILWAINPDPAQRCPSARDFQDSLASFTHSEGYHSSAREVAAWIGELFSGVEEFASLEAQTSSSRRLANNNSGFSTKKSTDSQRPALAKTVEDPKKTEFDIDTGIVPRSKTKSLRLYIISATVLLIAVFTTVWWLQRNKPVSPPLTSSSSASKKADEYPENVSIKLYLDEAERYAKSKRWKLALNMIQEARKVRGVKNPELTIRMIRITEEIELQALVFKSENHLRREQYPQAIEAAKQVLEHDPENNQAIELIALAKKKTEATNPVKVKEKTKEATLYISSSPAGLVFLDDEPIGRTPLKRRISAGLHAIQIRAPGHQPAEKTIRAGPGKSVQVKLSLAAIVEKKPLVFDDKSDAKEEHVDSQSKMPSPTSPISSSPPTSLASATKSSALSAMPSSAGQISPPAVSHFPKKAPAPAVTKVAIAAARPSEAIVKPKFTAKTSTENSANQSSTTRRPVVSRKPKSPVPAPRLAKEYQSNSRSGHARVLKQAEEEAISVAGVSPNYARGITARLLNILAQKGFTKTCPSCIYYFIVREAALGNDNDVASRNLVAMYRSGQISRLQQLPTR